MRGQSVIIDFWYGRDELDDLHALDLKLLDIVTKAGVGEFDFHELNMDGTDGRLFMYGPNAETLFKTVLPELEKTDFMQGATATLRFDGARTIEVPIEIKL